jgi:hypothetical protein
MKKSDLKNGMLIQIANGHIYMILNDYAINYNDFFDLSSQQDDLTCEIDEFNIIKVSKVLTGYLLLPKHWTIDTLDNFLIWEKQKEL